MLSFVGLQVQSRKLLQRDLLSLRFYLRKTHKQRFARALVSFVHTKIPYAFPLPRLPHVLVVEPTSHCNLQCIMCPSPALKSPRGYMSTEVYDKVLREAIAGGVHRIRFVGLGEPTLHPRLAEMVRAAKKGGLYTEVSTNATLLTRELGAALIDAGLDEIGFSLDAVDEASFERIRKGAKYRDVVANIEQFLELCRAAGSSRAPITVARMVLMDDSDIPAFEHGWGGKVDSLQFNLMRVYAGAKLTRLRRRPTEEGAPATQIKRPVRCRQVMNHLIVCWDGAVGLCNQSSVLVGDVKSAPLEAIWRGHAMERVRGLHRAYEGGRVDVCRACPVMEAAVIPEGGQMEQGKVTVREFWREEQVRKD